MSKVSYESACNSTAEDLSKLDVHFDSRKREPTDELNMQILRIDRKLEL